MFFEQQTAALTGNAFMYSNISLKLLRSCFTPAGPSTGLCALNRISIAGQKKNATPQGAHL